MIRRLIYSAIAIVALSASLVSCSDHDFFGWSGDEDGMLTLNFTADVPDMQVVQTRAVDPDGGGVQNMTLFCFDSYGLFISTVSATVKAGAADENGYSLSGDYSAEVPANTRAIHFVANQNLNDFGEDKFRNKSEAEVMSVLEGSSGRMIYWGRFACDRDDESDIASQLKSHNSGTIELIRNHARISIENGTSNQYLEVTGFTAVNTHAFGTVAPYHPTMGYDFEWENVHDTFVTLPSDKAKLSDNDIVAADESMYVYESDADDPVEVIIRGIPAGNTEERYYRVSLMDNDTGEQLAVCRNHHYRLNIVGALSYGQTSLEAALTAPATNNVWVSISDEVKEVENETHILAVEKAVYVLSEDEANVASYMVKYTLTGKDGTTITKGDEATVTWLDGNTVASQELTQNFTVDANGVGQGTIFIHPQQVGDNEKLEGTLLVKYGQLQRRIKVIILKQKQFTPAWVGTQVYGTVTGDTEEDLKNSRAHVTLMFNIPETCPEEMFPMNVYISVNGLDIRSQTGMDLAVVSKGDDDWYGEDNEWGYKYVYVATGPGVQRVYFENILNQAAGESGEITIEAKYFDTVKKTYTFSDAQKSITVPALSTYVINPDASTDGQEVVYYRLVPQKRYASVQFDMVMTDNADDSPFNVGDNDEFLLYSQYLDYYTDDNDFGVAPSIFDCEFRSVDEGTWSTGGRVLGFKVRDGKRTPTNTGHYSIYMYTTRANSEEVVRIASNQPESPSIFGTGDYSGDSYRSVTFELANYNPFRFSAQLNYNNTGETGTTNITGDAAEAIDELTWPYEPNKQVDIEIDVTSFAGSDKKSVDPFGEEFEIYIDAPMLSIDATRLNACKLNSSKLYKDPTVAGRFIYKVDADRETERNYGTGTALKTDNISGVNQSMERKTLPFVTSSIVSAGDIKISSNTTKVVYFAKTFRVSNTPITGTLKYMDADGTTTYNVQKGAFVSFELVKNNQRIGVITVTSDGNYELKLRKEYSFEWNPTKDGEVELHYQATDGSHYFKRYANLATLYDEKSSIVLEPMGQGGYGD